MTSAERSGEDGRRWMPSLAAALAVVLTVLLSIALSRQEERVIEERLRFGVTALRAEVARELEAHLQALERMARRAERSGPSGLPAWQADASQYVTDLVGLEQLVWLARDGAILGAEPAGLGGELGTAGVQRGVLADDDATMNARVVRDDATGSRRLLLSLRISDRGDVLAAHFDLDTLVDGILPSAALRDYHYALYKDGGVIYPAELPRPDPLGDLHAKHDLGVDQLPDVDFVVFPSERFLARSRGPWPAVVLLAGLGLATILFWLLSANQVIRRQRSELRVAREKLEQKVEERTTQVRTLADYNQLLFDSTAEAIYSIDPSGHCTAANRACADLLGFAGPEELIGHQMHELIHHTRPDGTPYPNEQCKIYEAFRERKRCHVDDEVLWRADGGAFEAEYWSHPIVEDGEVVGCVVTFLDITDRKAAERQILSLNQELEERVRLRTAQLESSNAELESFTYSVSHDLRAPLRAIDGFSKLVLQKQSDRLDDEGRRMLTIIRDNVLKMGQLIDDLLAFSQVGRHDLGRTPVDMQALAEEVFAEIAEQHPDRTIEFQCKDLPAASADRALCRQIWANLLGNAVKFTREARSPRIEVTGERRDDQVVYTVRDNGVGFDERFAAKLFQVFQRLHKSTDFEGTGVGLAIVERIVTRHGGRITAASPEGRGAIFSFSMPAID